MAQKQYNQEFKEQVIKECNEVGNVSLVACRHDISSNTIYGRISAAKNMNIYVELFHAILDDECYSRYEFSSFMEAYATITEYMRYYNERRRHVSINMWPQASSMKHL